MKYKVHYGKAGVYGELRRVDWLTEDGKDIASSCEGVGQKTISVTLYNAAGKGFTHMGFTPEQADNIVAAHLKEQGFDERTAERFDIKAYND